MRGWVVLIVHELRVVIELTLTQNMHGRTRQEQNTSAARIFNFVAVSCSPALVRLSSDPLFLAKVVKKGWHRCQKPTPICNTCPVDQRHPHFKNDKSIPFVKLFSRGGRKMAACSCPRPFQQSRCKRCNNGSNPTYPTPSAATKCFACLFLRKTSPMQHSTA